MRYEWDERQRQANIGKHGSDFGSVHAFEWNTAQIVPRPRDGEMRYIALEYIAGRLYRVICTERGAVTRIIGFRPASNDGRNHYAQA